MLTNATITRIDSVGTPSPTGAMSYTEGALIACRCCLDEPRTGQKWIIGATIKEATAVVYVQEQVVQPGMRMVVAADGESDVVYLVLHVVRRIHGGVTHCECYLKIAT